MSSCFLPSKIGECEISIDTNVCKLAPYKLKQVVEDGLVVIVYENECKQDAEKVYFELKLVGYRVMLLSVDERRQVGEIPEYARWIFAVGERLAPHVAKKKAKAQDVGWSVLWTAPTHDDIMRDYPPKQVFIDKNVLINCSNEQIASGWGVVLSEPLRAFENNFLKCVLALDLKESFVKIEDRSAITLEDLALTLLKISAGKRRDDSADVMAKCMVASALKDGRKPRRLGEYKFVASALIFSFYNAYLGSPSIDTLVPADKDKERKQVKALQVNVGKDVKKIDFFDINSYFRISYILSEYRMDLLEKQTEADFHTAGRFWRRLYKDAGFWLKSELSSAMLFDCMSLAGSMSDNLLAFAYATGFLTRL